MGAAKLRNTLWFLEKGFHVWAVEFPELSKRLPGAKRLWDLAKQNPKFHGVTPKEFIKLKEKFDIILLINEINIMPLPYERFLLLTLCREKIKEKGELLWHQWRALSTNPEKYTEENAFIDGYLMGAGPHHTFYVEHDKEEAHEILYSTGFVFNKDRHLSNIPSNVCYSYIFNSKHDPLIKQALEFSSLQKKRRDYKKIISLKKLSVLELYLKELAKISPGRSGAHKYHLIASRIFLYIFKNQLKEPIIEKEVNEGRGRIDICYKRKNERGIFKDIKELRDIPCPNIIVECKNYNNDLTNSEYAQLNDRLSPQKGMLGFLLCRDKKDKAKVIKHCQDRNRGGNNKYIVVLDDKDLNNLALSRINSEDDVINDFIEKKIDEIID